MKLLVVEDCQKQAAFLARAFGEHGYVVDRCPNGERAVRVASGSPYDLIILDWNLPGRDGLSVCAELRRRGNRVGILMLSARHRASERVLALDAGADDYLTKPYDLHELLARVRALLRRCSGATTETIRVGPVAIVERTRTAFLDGARVDLTFREFALLAYLAQRAGQTVTRAEILAKVWETTSDPGSNVIEVHVARLRKKVQPGLILRCMRGIGYRLEPQRPTENDAPPSSGAPAPGA